MEKNAVISDDGKYRYSLSRKWDKTKPEIMFIMLNPSTADDTVDDRTIKRIINFSKTWGYGGLLVGNIYAYRSSNPKLLRDVDDPIGPENEKYIRKMLQKVNTVVYAWGDNNKKGEPDWLKNIVKAPLCIEISQQGNPRHPLMLKKIVSY